MKRYVLGLVFIATAATGPTWAQGAGALDEARRLAAVGAVDLAIDRIDRDQSKQPDSPGWADWEALRLELLASRGRDAELLARMKAYPEPAPLGRASIVSLTTAARSALRASAAGAARHFLARLFLQPDLTSSEYRSARLMVIDAFLAEGDADAAYRTMLRFQQDFTPLRTEEAERFAAGLIEAGRVNDAANWLTRLEPSSPWSAILRMRAGLLSPEAAMAQARTAIAKGGGASAWALLAAAGRARGNQAIAIEVSEHRLNDASMVRAKPDHSQAIAALWRLYGEAAQQTANQAQLLRGDDRAWLNQASRSLKTQPQLARALLGHLALNAGSSEMRSEALLNMIAALRDSKLTTAAVRLYSDPQRFPVDAMDERVRLELGAAAMEAGQPELAVRYWYNLAGPGGTSAPQWQVRYCSALMQAGRGEEALAVARNLLMTKPPPAPDVVRRLIDVALYAQAGAQVRPARTMLTMLLPLVSEADRSAVLTALGRIHEADADHRAAASAYLQAAVAAAAPDSDREALRAREAAAGNLLRSGLRDDARAVYEWLARNARDAGIKDAATRMLKVLN